MYIPPHFAITDRSTIINFIEENAFGQLISHVDGKLLSTHAPFLFSEDKSQLIVHLAKQNPQVMCLDQQEVLITFQGPHDYISPSCYSNFGVPTWNYQIAHVYGTCKLFTEEARLKKIVDDLVVKYESQFEQPWQTVFKSQMLSAIVGIEIDITDMQCAFKLSQNKTEQDQLAVIQQLDDRGCTDVADAMKSLKGRMS